MNYKNFIKKYFDLDYVKLFDSSIENYNDYLKYIVNAEKNNFTIDFFWSLEAATIAQWFDEKYYLSNNSKLFESSLPIIDFIFNFYNNRTPGSKTMEQVIENFSSEDYLRVNPDVSENLSFKKDALKHYLIFGFKEERLVHEKFGIIVPDFDKGYYSKKYNVSPSIALAHYYYIGYKIDNFINEETEILKQHFDEDFYRKQLGESVANIKDSLFFHFLTEGFINCLSFNQDVENQRDIFDENFYNLRYSLLSRPNQVKGYPHYLRYGYIRQWFVNKNFEDNKDFIENFNLDFYKNTYEDLEKVHIPLLHYLNLGLNEGRNGSFYQVKKSVNGVLPYTLMSSTKLFQNKKQNIINYESLTLSQVLLYKQGIKESQILVNIMDMLKQGDNYLFITHVAGGGAQYYLNNKVLEYTKMNKTVLMLRYYFSENRYTLEIVTSETHLVINSFDIEVLLKLNLNLNTIFINSLHRYVENKTFNIKYFIVNVKKFQKCKLVFLAHDYDLISTNTTNTDNIDNIQIKQYSMLTKPEGYKQLSLLELITNTQIMLNNCDKYIFFSKNTLSFFRKVVELDEQKIELKPHALNFTEEDFKEFHQNGSLSAHKPFTVVICGNIEKHKGADIVHEFAKLCLNANLNIRILIVGSFSGSKLPNMIITGPYENSCIPQIFSLYKPNIVFFSSICNETFSYVAHDLQMSKLPIVCFDIGAQAETIREYEHGYVLDEICADSVFNTIVEFYKNYLLSLTVSENVVDYRFIDRKNEEKNEISKNLTYKVCLNVRTEDDDYVSVVKHLSKFDDVNIDLQLFVPERTDQQGILNSCKDVLPKNCKVSLFITQQGNGLWIVYNNYIRVSDSDKLLYITAFDKNMPELEKWYNLEYLLGSSSSSFVRKFNDLEKYDFVSIDNYFTHNNEVSNLRISRTMSYMNERAVYCPLGYLENSFNCKNYHPCNSSFFVNTKVLKNLDNFFAKECLSFFSDISDNDLINILYCSKLSNYSLLIDIPVSVALEEFYTQRDMYKKWSINHFNPKVYTNLYADIKSEEIAFNHFNNYGFDEGRKYCDELSIESLKSYKEFENLDTELLDYCSCYKEAAIALYLYQLDVNDYRDFVGKKNLYLDNITNLKTYSVDFSSIMVSFLVPVYNSEEFLENCLNSIYNVDYPNIEVVLCDDGSSDRSPFIIQQFKNKYPEITKVVIHKENKCFAVTHKDLINQSTGKYFTIIDADDYISKDYAKQFVKFMEFNSLDVCVCDWSRPRTLTKEFVNNEVIFEPQVFESDSLKLAIGNWSHPALPNVHYGLNRKMYNRVSFLSRNPITIREDMAFNEDFSATLKLFSNENSKVGLFKNRIYAWYDNANSVSYSAISERVISNLLYVFLDDLEETLKVYPDSANKIILAFERHLFAGLDKITVREILKRRLDYLAEQLDLYSSKFDKLDKKVITYIKARFNPIYKRAITTNKYSKITVRKVAVIDSIGHTELKDCLLDSVIANDIPYYYLECSKDYTFKELTNIIEEVNDCSFIITNGGWGADELVTNLPIIKVWHGMGAVKYVPRFPQHLQPMIGVSSSKDVNFCYKWMYNLPDNRILDIGNLLCIKLLDKEYMQLRKLALLEQYPQFKEKKCYLWCPTFRGYEPNYRLMEPMYDFTEVSKAMNKNELFLVKLHPCLKYFDTDISIDFDNLDIVVDVTDLDLIDLLAITDVCLTDYSSCIFYASLMNIPIGVLATDVDEYCSSRGFFIDVRNDMPCDVFESVNTKQLMSYIRTRTCDSDKYKKFREMHVGGVQDNVNEILCSLIKKLIKEGIS